MTTVAPTQAPAELSRTERRRLSEATRAERRFAWTLCAPAVIVMAAVTLYPIIYAIYLSLQRYDLRFPQQTHFVGLSNYGAVITSPVWWEALWVTVVITVVSVAVEFVLGMSFAMLLNYTPIMRGVTRTCLLIPYGIVTVAAAYSWQFAWTPGVGYLANLLPAGSAPLTNQWQAIGIIILAEIWKTTPFMTLMLLAGLTLIPDELLRAAKVDGASMWQRLFQIMMPLMKPAIMVALLFRVLDAFRIFDNIFILTKGNNHTQSVSILGYDNLFTALNLGIGSAISVMILLCVAIIAFVFIVLFGTAAPGTALERR